MTFLTIDHKTDKIDYTWTQYVDDSYYVLADFQTIYTQIGRAAVPIPTDDRSFLGKFLSAAGDYALDTGKAATAIAAVKHGGAAGAASAAGGLAAGGLNSAISKSSVGDADADRMLEDMSNAGFTDAAANMICKGDMSENGAQRGIALASTAALAGASFAMSKMMPTASILTPRGWMENEGKDMGFGMGRNASIAALGGTILKSALGQAASAFTPRAGYKSAKKYPKEYELTTSGERHKIEAFINVPDTTKKAKPMYAIAADPDKKLGPHYDFVPGDGSTGAPEALFPPVTIVVTKTNNDSATPVTITPSSQGSSNTDPLSLTSESNPTTNKTPINGI